MAEIPTYEQRFLPQGQLNVQASPDQMGAGIGRSISQLGEQFDRIEQDKGQVWAYKASSDAYEELRKKYVEDLNSLNPTDTDFTAKLGNLSGEFKAKIDQRTSDLIANAPSGYAARAVEMQMLRNSSSLMNAAIEDQARVTGEMLKSSLEASVIDDEATITVDPSNINFERVMENRAAMIGSMNTVGPQQKIKWIEDTRKNLAKVQVGVQAQTNPNFLQLVSPEGGKVVPGQTVQNFKASIVKPYGRKEIDAAARQIKAASKYDEWFDEAARKYGVDPVELKLRAVVESSLNPNAVSSQGAIGIMQFMPETAKGIGVNPKDARESIFGAARLMADYLKKAGGDMSKVDMMYYGGESGTQWGPNTKQYAANLAALRGVLGGAPSDLPQIELLPEDKIASAEVPIAGWQYLDAAERAAAVRAAESVASAKLGVERGEVRNNLQDFETALMAGENVSEIEGSEYSRENLIRLYGDDNGARAYDALQNAKAVGSFVRQLSTMSESQIPKLLETLKPVSGEMGYEVKKKNFDYAVQAATKIRELRNDDYMNWALNTPNMNVKPIDISNIDNFRQSLVARIPAVLTARQDYNVDSGVFSKGEVEDLGEFFNRMNPQDTILYLREMRSAFTGKDNMFFKAMQQLSPKNTMLAFAASTSARKGLVETTAGKQSGEMVAQYILEGARILQGRDLGDPTKSGRPMEIKESDFRTRFWSSVGANAFASPDADFSNRMAADTYQAAKNYLAAKMMRAGKQTFSRSDVNDAVSAVTGGVTTLNNSKLFLPWGTTKSEFEQRFPTALQSALKDSGLAGTSLDAPGAYEYSNVGDGKYLITNAGKALVGKNGPVIVNVGPTREKLPAYFRQLQLPRISDGR